MNLSELPSQVRQAHTLNISGNVTPQIWYQRLRYRTPGGKVRPHLLAIIVLSDCLYWYRPTEVRDESSGQITGYRKKFAGDYLQRSYDQVAATYGCSEKEAKDAVIFLEESGLLKRHVKKSGPERIDRLFLELKTNQLQALTYAESWDFCPVKIGYYKYDLSGGVTKMTPGGGVTKMTPGGVTKMTPTETTNTKTTNNSYPRAGIDLSSREAVEKIIELYAKKLKKDWRAQEQVCRAAKWKPAELQKSLNENETKDGSLAVLYVNTISAFFENAISEAKDTWEGYTDARTHFVNWVKYKARTQKEKKNGTTKRKKTARQTPSGRLITADTARAVFSRLAAEGI